MSKVLIRPLEISDAQISWKWRNDAKIWELTGSSPKQKITHELELNWIQKVIADQTTRRFAILVDDIYVGNIQLTDIIENEMAQYHIFIGDVNYWGKGIAKLATYQILYYAKEILCLKKVFLKVRKENISAVNVYAKSGFVIASEDEGWLIMNCDLSELLKPSVSIFVMVYNHELFLKECLEGLLMQQCNFNFDIVVGEDCSSDNSREILLNYQARFPGKFRLLLHEKNVGAHKNQEAILKKCSGSFIAICEGDDYWTDPLKLQKQVKFLENNIDFSICFTDYKTYSQNLNSYFYPKLVEKHSKNNVFLRRNIILNNFIPTLTVVFRNNPKILVYLKENLFPGDWFLHILNSKYGKIKFLNFESAVYRMHDGGVCSPSNPILNNQKYLKSIDLFRAQFKNDYLLQFFFMLSKVKISIQTLKIRLKFILKK